MIRSVHMNCCVAAQKSVLLFKGPGSLNFVFLIGGNVEYLKAYPLPLTPPSLVILQYLEMFISLTNESHDFCNRGHRLSVNIFTFFFLVFASEGKVYKLV